MSRIQLPYGVFEDNKANIKLNLPRNYKAGEYFKKFLYLNNIDNPAFQNSWQMSLIVETTSANSWQKHPGKPKAVVTNGKFNDAVVQRALDTTDKNVQPNPFQVTFKDLKKLDAQNSVLGNLLRKQNEANYGTKK